MFGCWLFSIGQFSEKIGLKTHALTIIHVIFLKKSNNEHCHYSSKHNGAYVIVLFEIIKCYMQSFCAFDVVVFSFIFNSFFYFIF